MRAIFVCVSVCFSVCYLVLFVRVCQFVLALYAFIHSFIYLCTHSFMSLQTARDFGVRLLGDRLTVSVLQLDGISDHPGLRQLLHDHCHLCIRGRPLQRRRLHQHGCHRVSLLRVVSSCNCCIYFNCKLAVCCGRFISIVNVADYTSKSGDDETYYCINNICVSCNSVNALRE